MTSHARFKASCALIGVSTLMRVAVGDGGASPHAASATPTTASAIAMRSPEARLIAIVRLLITWESIANSQREEKIPDEGFHAALS